MLTDLTPKDRVLKRLSEQPADVNDGYVFAGDLVDLIPPGKFWETMDSLGLRSVAIRDPETGRARTAFRAVRR